MLCGVVCGRCWEGGNSVVACWRASLMVLGICLYVDWNFFGVSMVLVYWFWSCGSVMMLYIYSLLRYFWDWDLERSVRLL